MRIALFHHDSSVASEITAALSGAGEFGCMAHDNALVGLAQVSSGAPDVVLAAGDLPIIDGFQLCSLMKSEDYPSLNAIPVVIFGQDRLELAQRAKECGAIDYVVWPQEPAVLAFALNRAVAGAASSAANPVVLVVGEKGEAYREVNHELGSMEGLEVLELASAQALQELEEEPTVALVVVESEPASLPEQVSKECEKRWPGTALIVATVPRGQTTSTRIFRRTVSHLIAETAAPGQLGDVCRYQLRKRQAQRAVPRAREDILTYFFEASDAALLIVSARDGAVRAANDAAVRLMRVSRKQIERGSLTSAFPPHKRKALEGLLGEAGRSGLAHAQLDQDISGGRVAQVSITRLGWADLCLVTLADRLNE